MRIKKRGIALGIGAVALGLGAGFVALACQSFGKSPSGERAERIKTSPEWKNGHFENPEPLRNNWLKAMGAMFWSSADSVPQEPMAFKTDAALFAKAPASGLRVTWFGHSTTLIEIDGFRILTDPIFSRRTSPVSWLGPERWYDFPLAPEELPHIDAVVISHDHYDHLDMETVKILAAKKVLFVVPLSVGANLAYWGVDESQIVELDWWQEKTLEHSGTSALRIAATPARHASGRYLFDNDKKLWAGYALIGKKNRVYFSGDTGLFKSMKDIGVKYGPFDLAMIEVGQYHRAWPDWHIGPEQAVKAHQWVKGRIMLPIHWGLFKLAPHSWTEPIERVTREGQKLSVKLVTPKPGESFEPTNFQSTRWWPDTKWQTAEEHPIISSQVE